MEKSKCEDCGKATDNYYSVVRRTSEGRVATRKCVWCHELEIRQCGILARRQFRDDANLNNSTWESKDGTY